MTISAWFFCSDDRRLRFDDNRPIVDGETLAVDCEPVLCYQGLHASVRLRDALSYAPGLVLCRVTIGGQVVEGVDKLAGQTRRVEWSLPSKVVRESVVKYAEWCSDKAIAAAVTDYYSVEVKNYLQRVVRHNAEAVREHPDAAFVASYATWVASYAAEVIAAEVIALSSLGAGYIFRSVYPSALAKEQEVQEQWLLAAVELARKESEL
jgi:hypothetical protein